MKHLLLIIFTLGLFVQNSNAQNSKLVGTWLVTKVEAGCEIQEPYQVTEFTAEGKMVMMGMEVASWKYNKKINSIEMESDFDKDFSGVSKILKLNADELICIKDDVKIFYQKLDKNKIVASNKESGLLGMWDFEDISNTDTKSFITFKEPDEFIIIQKGEYSESTIHGSWIFNKKEKSLLIIGQIENLRGKNKVAKIDKNEIELVNNGVILKAKRKLKSTTKIERLSFTEADFYDENDEYKYYDDEAKLPWQDVYKMIADMANVKQLIYTYSTLIRGTEVFENKILTANVKASKEEQALSIDFIFYGYDRYNLPEDTELPPNKNYTNLLYPEKESSFRVTGTEQITTPAGTFDCTVLEVCGGFDIRKKLWMINDKPGIYAKIIEDKSGDFGHYKNFELLEIK